MKVPALPWRRLAGFSALPALAALTPLVALPMISRVLGVEGWSSMSIGMAVGMFGAGVLDFGYGVLGPSRVARAPQADRPDLYLTSLRVRGTVALALVPLLYLSAELIDPARGQSDAGAMALATAAVGLAPTWYYIGVGRALGVALWDTAPRLVVTALAGAALVATRDALVFPVVLGSGTLLIYALAGRRIIGPWSTWLRKTSGFKEIVRRHAPLVGAGLLSSGYTTLTIPLVTLVNYPAVASFAAMDRLRGMLKQGEVAVGNGFQHWVVEEFEDRHATRRRMRTAFLAMAATGAIVAVGTALTLPLVVRVLLGPAIPMTYATACYAGLTLLFVACTISLNYHVLAPLQRSRAMAFASALGALVGVPAILVLARIDGATGATAAIALSEGAVLVYLLLAARRALGAWVRD